MFYTIQELLAQIKGWEYIIAILFLALFVGFWQVLSRAPRRPQLLPARGPSRPLQEGYKQQEGDPLRGSTPQVTPCWEARQCPPETRDKCPGYMLKPLPCWIARSLVSGKTWEACADCPVYTEGMQRIVEAASGGSAPPSPESSSVT